MVDIVRIYADRHGLFIKPRVGNINIYRPQRSTFTRPSVKQLANGFASQLRSGQQVRVRHLCSGSGTIELVLLNSDTVEQWCSHGPCITDDKKFDSIEVWKPYEESTVNADSIREV